MARTLFANLGRKAADDQDDLDQAEKARRAKKAKKAEGEKDDEDDDKKDKDDEKDAKASAARGRERDRIRAILTSAPAQLNIAGAAHLALDTTMPRADAIETLERLNAATGARGAGAGGPTLATAAAILAAAAKARGEAPPRVPGQRQRMGYAEGEAPPAPLRRSTATGPDGRPVDAAAAAIIAAGAKRRGED